MKQMDFHLNTKKLGGLLDGRQRGSRDARDIEP